MPLVKSTGLRRRQRLATGIQRFCIHGQPRQSPVLVDFLRQQPPDVLVLGGDLGASELIAVRAAHDDYRTDLFVYGNQFHRIPRDSGLERTKAQWDQHDFTGGDQNDLSAATSKKLVDMLKDTRTNTMNWGMVDPKDYPQLVRFLDNTKDYTEDTCAADGKHLRVWVTFTPVNLAHPSVCTLPVDSGLTTWKASDYFKNVNVLDRCKVWGQVLGRLAHDYPHLVALSIDDFTHDIDNPFTPEYIAEMESVIIERPSANGPYGAKGIGEMTANSPIPAIANAIFDACGVRVTTMPITPIVRTTADRVTLMSPSWCDRDYDLAVPDRHVYVYTRHSSA